MNIFEKFFSNSAENNKLNFKTTKSERDVFCEEIIETSAPSSGFYLLLTLSILIISVGLTKNNTILLIGGMLVAPLLSPILSIALSLTIFNLKVFKRSVRVFFISSLVSIIFAFIIGKIMNFSLEEIELLTLMDPGSVSSFIIPIAAGMAASFSWIKKNLTGSLPGVAITVTILPPLALMGLSLVTPNFEIFLKSLSIYLLNVVGIIIGGLIILLFMGFESSSTKKVIEEIKKDG